jgi:hypothetical protein
MGYACGASAALEIDGGVVDALQWDEIEQAQEAVPCPRPQRILNRYVI